MCCPFKDMPWGSVLAGTGHRPDKLGGYGPSPIQTAVRAAIRERLLHYRLAHGLRGIYGGMALGFDTWWAEEALNLHIPVVAVVPFSGQEKRWPSRPRDGEQFSPQQWYRMLLARCANVIVLHPTKPPNYRVACDWMDERNLFMVRNAWGTVACYNGDVTGGTANTVRLVGRLQKPIDIINPRELAA